MALTNEQTTQVFKIFGLPQNGVAYVAFRLVSLTGPAAETFDFTAAVNGLGARLAALNAEQEAEVAALLSEWSALEADYSELRVYADGGSAGRLVDHPVRAEKLRATLSNLIGFAVPSGGFVAEVHRLNGGRIVR